MNISLAAQLMRGALIQTVIIAGPVLLVSMVVGLIVGIIQTTTSVQEQTLSFVPKIISIFTVLALLGITGLTLLREYAIRMFSMISALP